MLNIQDTWQAQILHLLRLELGGEGDGGSSLGTCLALEWILGKMQCLRGGITEERKEGMLWWWEELFISKTVLELVEKALHFLAVKKCSQRRGENLEQGTRATSLSEPETVCAPSSCLPPSPGHSHALISPWKTHLSRLFKWHLHLSGLWSSLFSDFLYIMEKEVQNWFFSNHFQFPGKKWFEGFGRVEWCFTEMSSYS